MAHNLDTTDGVTSFVSARTMGWHQLGELLPEEFTAEQAMEYGKLGGWDVRKTPAYTIDEKTGLTVPMTGCFATVRDNPVREGQVDFLGYVGNSYRIVQNEDHAEFLNTLVDESGAHFDTAGAINGGRTVFITMKLPGHMMIGGKDQVDLHIAAVNTHDGTGSFTIMVTPVRIVCENTLNCAYSNHSNIFRIRHTSGLHHSLASRAREVLDMTFDYADAFQAEAEKLINTTMTFAQFEAIIEKEFGAPEDASLASHTRANTKIEEIMELFAEAQTQEGIRDTAWAGFNALTEWNDHFSPTRGDDRDNARAAKAIFDPSFKNRSLELMLATV
jgi:phage/plasmid-like protein (TIGR03299 family)